MINSQILKKTLFLVVFLLVIWPVKAQNTPRFVAEWEPAWGTLIRWPLGIPADLVVELAESDSLYVLVESPYERDQAIASFTGWGVNMEFCKFIFAPTYSHWTRDWGPHYVFNTAGIASIADPVFDGYPWVPGCNGESNLISQYPDSEKLLGYEEDDAVNPILADSFNCPVIDLSVYLTGGNIMVDGYGTAISTQQMLDENIPLVNQDDFFGIMEDSTGITNYLIVDNPEVYGIQHIDCYAKFLDESTILVKQVDEWHPEFQCCEDLASQLANSPDCWGDPYNIIRIYCGSYNGVEVAAYTNSLILNKKVFVPLFGIASDENALATYEEAMPGYDVIGFEWDDWYYYDALHCRTMGVFDRYMLRLEHDPYNGNVVFNQSPEFIVKIDDRSEAGLIQDSLKFFWKSENSAWNWTYLMPTGQTDSLAGQIPYPVIGESYEYYFIAADASGRVEKLPRTAPLKTFSFTIENIVSETGWHDQTPEITVFPSPFSKSVHISTKGFVGQPLSLRVVNINGFTVRILTNANKTKHNRFTWDGKDNDGNKCKPGVYFLILNTASEKIIKTCILNY